MLHASLKLLPFRLSDRDTPEHDHVRHWRYDFPFEDLERNPLMRQWRDIIVGKARELLPGMTGRLVEVYSNNHGYGDHQHAHVDTPATATVLYYANAEWNEDWQGETVIYDGNDDPYYSVAPRPGRLLIFPSRLAHRGGTPSRTCLERRLVVVFKFGGAA